LRTVQKGDEKMLDRVKCPKCGGPINKVFFVQFNHLNNTAEFIAECWSGDLHTQNRPRHLFLVKTQIDDEVIHADAIITISGKLEDALAEHDIDVEAELWNVVNQRLEPKPKEEA
jgi:hypothetical protein